jgi:uncharacterized membrane protein
MNLIALLITVHALAAIVWVGGMFFAHLALRPAALLLEAPARLNLWQAVFGRFFPWVWASVLGLLASGHLLLANGIGLGSPAVHAMAGIGWIMALIFTYLFFGPYRQLRSALTANDIPAAGLAQGRIRMIVTINLTLGLITSALGAAAHFMG